MKTLKIMLVAAFLMAIAVGAYANDTTGPLNVKANIGNTLEFAYWIMPMGGLTSTTEFNFGTLTVDGSWIRSAGWFEANFQITSNAPTWSLKSNATAITSGADTLPVGSLQVNGPSTSFANVNANTGADITVATNLTWTNLANPVVVVYSMPTGKTPSTQANGSYAGTVTVTLTS